MGYEGKMVTGNGGDGDRKWRWRLCWNPVTETLVNSRHIRKQAL